MICRLLKESLSYDGNSLYLKVIFSFGKWLLFVSEWRIDTMHDSIKIFGKLKRVIC